jgi:methyl-accepting chemotaxis protein
MSLSVSQRITGGFSLVVVLSIGIFIVSLIAMGNINKSVINLSDKALPMTTMANGMHIDLMESITSLLKYLQSNSIDSLDKEATIFQSNQKSLAKKTDKLLASGNELQQSDLTAAINDSRQASDAFFAAAPKLMDAHHRDVELGIQIITSKKDLSDLTDELTVAINKSSNFDPDTKTTLQSKIEDVVAAAISGTEKPNTSAVANVIKKVQKNISTLSNAVAADSASKATFEKFNELIVGSSGILPAYSEQLTQRKAALDALEETQRLQKKADSKINDIIDQVDTLAATSSSAAAKNVSNSRLLLSIFALVAIVVAAITAAVVIQSIRQPLSQVMRIVRAVASGNLRETINIDRQDELGELAAAMQQLTTQLRDVMQQISSGAEQLAASAEECSSVSLDSFNNVNLQKEQTLQVATAISQMTSAVEEVARGASDTRLRAEDAHKQSALGEQAMDSHVGKTRAIADSIEKAAANMQKLSEFSHSIGSVLDVIRGIAEQTNLLALNAAIEAARAGEQGRGFAVVADEVRTLASRTAASTTEIQSMIERLQTGTRAAVDDMASSRTQANEGVQEVAKAAGLLRDIGKSVQLIRDMSLQIASAAEEQSTVAHMLKGNVDNISNLADLTANGARDNQAASTELARLAEHQRVLVQRFQL